MGERVSSIGVSSPMWGGPSYWVVPIWGGVPCFWGRPFYLGRGSILLEWGPSYSGDPPTLGSTPLLVGATATPSPPPSTPLFLNPPPFYFCPPPPASPLTSNGSSCTAPLPPSSRTAPSEYHPYILRGGSLFFIIGGGAHWTPPPSFPNPPSRCGLVALWMGGSLVAPGHGLELAQVVQTALDRGYTLQGEMFSGI